MNNEAMKEVLNELFSHLERLEMQNEAILQFLKEKKRVTDKQLAPYLEQAGNASNVRWRAARVRIERMLSPEHPEKEVKLGKQPELREDAKRTESAAKEEKRTESVDKKEVKQAETDGNKSAPAAAVETRPADGKEDKPEAKSVTEPSRRNRLHQTNSSRSLNQSIIPRKLRSRWPSRKAPSLRPS
jgi:hypothetical protein